MQINKLYLENYRKFTKLEFNLHPQLNVIVGVNASGKSTILEAVSIAISSFTLGMSEVNTYSIPLRDVRHLLIQNEGTSTVTLQKQFPTVVGAVGLLYEREIEWNRSLKSAQGKTTMIDAKELEKLSSSIEKKVNSGNERVLLPILSYYGTGRLWSQKKRTAKSNRKNISGRWEGYTDSLAAKSNEKLMIDWFKKETVISLQSGHEKPEYIAVKKAIESFFIHLTNSKDVEVRYDFDIEDIVVVHAATSNTGSTNTFSEMSDGYRNTLGMILDIAYRMAKLNPFLLEKVLTTAPGVILIDEVDLHLHPKWQKQILGYLTKTFPKVQFIVTTHAPAVIQSVKNENILILNEHGASMAKELTFGRSMDDILRKIMDTDVRPKQVLDLVDKIGHAMDREDYSSARQLCATLEDIVGSDDPEVMDAKISIEFNEVIND